MVALRPRIDDYAVAVMQNAAGEMVQPHICDACKASGAGSLAAGDCCAAAERYAEGYTVIVAITDSVSAGFIVRESRL